MQKFLAALLSLITTALCFPRMQLQAAHTTPLFHAAREYRDATQYLSRVLTYHTSLAPPHQQFLTQLIHSGHQLYAATLASPPNAAGRLGTEFRQTWSKIQTLVENLPWMIDTLPPEAKQTVAPNYRQFIATFQTLAVQIALSEPVDAPVRRGSPQLKREKARRHMLISGSQLTTFPRSRSHDRSRASHSGREILEVIFLSRQTLSPSEWQSHLAGIRARSERPTQREHAKTGAQLTRLTQPRHPKHRKLSVRCY